MPIDFGVMALIVKVTGVAEVEFHFYAISQKRSGQMPIEYGVAILNFGVTQCKQVKNYVRLDNTKT